MQIDFEARYTVKGWEGIAFYLIGYYNDEGRETDDWYLSRRFVDTDCVVAVMVGDDREHIVDVEDLIILDDNAYCSGCGQVGCCHG